MSVTTRSTQQINVTGDLRGDIARVYQYMTRQEHDCVATRPVKAAFSAMRDWLINNVPVVGQSMGDSPDDFHADAVAVATFANQTAFELALVLQDVRMAVLFDEANKIEVRYIRRMIHELLPQDLVVVENENDGHHLDIVVTAPRYATLVQLINQVYRGREHDAMAIQLGLVCGANLGFETYRRTFNQSDTFISRSVFEVHPPGHHTQSFLFRQQMCRLRDVEWLVPLQHEYRNMRVFAKSLGMVRIDWTVMSDLWN